MVANDAANASRRAHGISSHGAQIPMERALDAAGKPDGTRTVEGRIFGDRPWDTESGQQNKSFKWKTLDLMNETVNRYLQRNWAKIREDLALLG